MLVLFFCFHSSNVVLSLFFHTSPSTLPFYTPGFFFLIWLLWVLVAAWEIFAASCGISHGFS